MINSSIQSSVSADKALQDILDKDVNDESIIEKFMERYSVSKYEAEEILEETKKWLWLASESIKEKSGIRLFIDNSLLVIDEMWHNFILHTRHYHKFCSEKLGVFVHHEPTPPSQKIKGFDSDFEKEKFVNEHKEKMKNQLSYIYDKLGPDTIQKWYEDFPERFSEEKLLTIK